MKVSKAFFVSLLLLISGQASLASADSACLTMDDTKLIYAGSVLTVSAPIVFGPNSTLDQRQMIQKGREVTVCPYVLPFYRSPRSTCVILASVQPNSVRIIKPGKYKYTSSTREHATFHDVMTGASFDIQCMEEGAWGPVTADLIRASLGDLLSVVVPPVQVQ